MQRAGVIVALGALLGMAAGGVTAAPALAGRASAGMPAPAAPGPPGSIHWGKCANRMLQRAHAACALLPVPLDYSNPAGPQIKIAISRILHTSPDYQGVILTNRMCASACLKDGSAPCPSHAKPGWRWPSCQRAGR